MSRRADYEPHTGDPEQDLAYDREQRARARTSSEFSLILPLRGFAGFPNSAIGTRSLIPSARLSSNII